MQGITCIAIVGVFSPLDEDIHQEEQVSHIIRRYLPNSHITLSRSVGGLGLIERENAAILNSSLLPYARRITRAFKSSAESLGLKCPVFVTTNDGMLLGLNDAMKVPIRTFSSGPTNSMRGANFLAELSGYKVPEKSALVIDVGGTSVSG